MDHTTVSHLPETTSSIICGFCGRPAGCSRKLAKEIGWKWLGLDWNCPDCFKDKRGLRWSIWNLIKFGQA